jgi:hypothetical protein
LPTRASMPWRKPSAYETLAPLIGGVINRKQIVGHWDEILRLATSIKHGSVTASLMLRKLGAYPRQNGLAVALRELGKVEGRYSCFSTSAAPNCGGEFMSGLTKARRKMPWQGPCSSTGSGNSGIERMKTSGIAQAG